MTENADARVKEAYHKSMVRKTTFISILLILLIIACIMSCAIGTGTGFFRAYEVIINHISGVSYLVRSPEWWEDYYIWNNVMPCVAMSVIAGAGLAVGGTVMQGIMGNPLADPYTTGISSGACLGAVTAIIVGFSFSTVSGEYGIVSNAFICALIPAIIVVVLVRYVDNSPSTIILIGVAVSYFFNALVTYLMITTDTDSLQAAFLWQIGSVSGASWSDIPLMLIAVVASSVLVQLAARKLNLLSLGDDSAKSLGLDVGKFRVLCLILLSFLIASIIAYTGIIGFVGLISPHMARFIIGGDNRFVAPAAIIIGALMLVIADIISRLLTSVNDIPIGVVMAFIGSPIFLYLVIRKRSNGAIY
jgi:iron complex transport system permease protein